MATDEPFWRTKRLDEMSTAEWESLCDGCGQCCLHKLQDEDTEEIALTDVACRLLDLESCRCTDYPNRTRHVPDCVQLTPDNAGALEWMPTTCAYRLLANGQPLEWWHPLRTGDPNSPHAAGFSVRGQAVSEDDIDDIQSHVIDWLNEQMKQGLAPLGRGGGTKRKRRRR